MVYPLERTLQPRAPLTEVAMNEPVEAHGLGQAQACFCLSGLFSPAQGRADIGQVSIHASQRHLVARCELSFPV